MRVKPYFFYILALIAASVAAWHLPFPNFIVVMVAMAVAGVSGALT